MVHHTILYLSDHDLDRLAPEPDQILAALENGLVRSRADAFTVPKLNLPIGPGHFFQALTAAAGWLDLAVVKWSGVVAENASRGLPNVRALILLSRLSDACPVAVMAGERITRWRTAAMSAAAAKRLARPDSRTIGFVGLGLQALSHLAAFQRVFPKLERACLLGRSPASIASFSVEVAEAGLTPVVCDSAGLLEASDIVGTTVPAQPGLKPFLDARRLRPGAFVSMVDLGRCWKPETLADLDIVATDDRVQSRALAADGKLARAGPWAADLVELIAGIHPGRTSPGQRTAFIFAGIGLGDLVVAAELYQKALAGAGTRLPA